MSTLGIRRTLTSLPCLRSVLFVPGHQPELIAKVPRFQPDLAVVDLEDAVPLDDKGSGRSSALRAIAELSETNPSQTVYLRVNGPRTPWFTDDVRAAASSRCAGLVLPKLENDGEVERLEHLLTEAGRPNLPVIAGLETVAGIARAERLCVSRLQAVYFGAGYARNGLQSGDHGKVRSSGLGEEML
jgi:citrate lyase subunit beta/citryl-CoA lyase